MALNGHYVTAVESLLLGAKRTLISGCTLISIYEYAPKARVISKAAEGESQDDS